MSRVVVLLFGAVLWVTFAIVALVHVVTGYGMVPVVASVLVATTVAVYHAWPRELAAASVEIDVRD